MSKGLDGITTESGFVLDACHDRIQPGDVIIADYRGRPDSEFTVLRDTGTGMFQIRDPAGKERPIRPSTLIAVAKRITRPDENWAIEGAATSSASRGIVRVTADGTLTPSGAREFARRIIQSAEDAEKQRVEGYA